MHSQTTGWFFRVALYASFPEGSLVEQGAMFRIRLHCYIASLRPTVHMLKGHVSDVLLPETPANFSVGVVSRTGRRLLSQPST